MSFDFFPNEQDATLRNAARRPSFQPEPGVWQGFLPGAGSYAMRSLAEVGRAVDMAGAVFPIAADAIMGGTEQQDRYFREHDEVFNSAVDYWTPRPGEVGIAGQVTGQLAGGVAQAIVSPALLVATSQLSTAEDLARQGVDATTANKVGGVAGVGMTIGVRMPFLGQTAASRIGSGVAGNVAQGAATAGASRALLNTDGYPAQAAQYDPLDIKARTLDALLGAAFGGLAHLQGRPHVSPREVAALLVTNQAHHMEATTAPGRPATDLDATAHVQALRRAIDQMLRDEPVTVDDVVKDTTFVADPVYSRGHDEVGAEILRLAREEAGGPPIEMPARLPDAAQEPQGLGARLRQLVGGKAAEAPPETDPMAAKARLAAARAPDMPVPTGQFAPDGTPVVVRAADYLAQADAETAAARRQLPDLFRTAASCLLGTL